jgi:2-C-methyl-D-erythritol 4-phosphate cytidylyltransferase
VLAQTIAVFEATPLIAHIALVVASERVDDAHQLAKQMGWQKICAIVVGGARRRDSVRNGLQALPTADEIAVIHDGARPLVTATIIAAGVRAAQAMGAATAGVPVKDTIKRVDADGLVVETPDRATLFAIQTPQVFRREVILAAHQAVDAALDVTDDAQMVEMQGDPVRVFAGAYTNLKITTPEDLAMVEALWQQREANI